LHFFALFCISESSEISKIAPRAVKSVVGRKNHFFRVEQKVRRIIYLLKYPHHLSGRPPGRHDTSPVPPLGESPGLAAGALHAKRVLFSNPRPRTVDGSVAGGEVPRGAGPTPRKPFSMGTTEITVRFWGGAGTGFWRDPGGRENPGIFPPRGPGAVPPGGTAENFKKLSKGLKLPC
jgi:hypothetical protein